MAEEFSAGRPTWHFPRRSIHGSNQPSLTIMANYGLTTAYLRPKARVGCPTDHRLTRRLNTPVHETLAGSDVKVMAHPR